MGHDSVPFGEGEKSTTLGGVSLARFSLRRHLTDGIASGLSAKGGLFLRANASLFLFLLLISTP